MKWSVWVSTTLVVCGTGVLTASCSQGGVTGKSPPQGLLDARLDQAFGSNCEVPGATRMLGTFGERPAAVSDGTQNAGVVCTVRDNGNSTFDVKGEITMNGDRWFAIEGTLPASYDVGASPKGVYVVGMRVTVSGAGPNGGPSIPYVQSDGGCLFRYVDGAQGLAGGRAWGVLECPRVEREINGGVDPKQNCVANVTFRFENCAY